MRVWSWIVGVLCAISVALLPAQAIGLSVYSVATTILGYALVWAVGAGVIAAIRAIRR